MVARTSRRSRRSRQEYKECLDCREFSTSGQSAGLELRENQEVAVHSPEVSLLLELSGKTTESTEGSGERIRTSYRREFFIDLQRHLLCNRVTVCLLLGVSTDITCMDIFGEKSSRYFGPQVDDSDHCGPCWCLISVSSRVRVFNLTM